MADKKATLTLQGHDPIELNVLSGTLGQDEVDIRTLGSKGLFTYDPGFTSTASCESKITYIDGEEGILLHRGFPIDQLAQESTFLEVSYLLLNGEVPTQKQFDEFKTNVTRHTMVHEQITRLFHGFRRDSHPMAVLCGVTGALAAFYHDSIDVENERHREIAAYRLLSKMPTVAAMCYKYSIGQPFVYPRNDLSYAGNFLHMMFSTPCEEYKVSSSGANPFACIAAGIASLWGPAHGGANEAALKMLEEISSVDHIPAFVKRAKDKNDSFRLMGFGHRVYKNYDPRATVMRETCHEVLKELDLKDNLLEVAMELEHIALNDPYFIEKKLYPNVDFYSGIILKAMGIPSSMFTVIFAMARTVGWIAHWSEMHQEGIKIARPRQLYTGYDKRDFHSQLKK